jgi:hypothetical protein
MLTLRDPRVAAWVPAIGPPPLAGVVATGHCSVQAGDRRPGVLLEGDPGQPVVTAVEAGSGRRHPLGHRQIDKGPDLASRIGRGGACDLDPGGQGMRVHPFPADVQRMQPPGQLMAHGVWQRGDIHAGRRASRVGVGQGPPRLDAEIDDTPRDLERRGDGPPHVGSRIRRGTRHHDKRGPPVLSHRWSASPRRSGATRPRRASQRPR